jgi:hypothetical protein
MIDGKIYTWKDFEVKLNRYMEKCRIERYMKEKENAEQIRKDKIFYEKRRDPNAVD